MQTWRRINHFKLVLQMGHTRNFSSSNAAFLRRGTGLYDPRGILRVEQNFRNYFQWLFYGITRYDHLFLSSYLPVLNIVSDGSIIKQLFSPRGGHDRAKITISRNKNNGKAHNKFIMSIIQFSPEDTNELLETDMLNKLEKVEKCLYCRNSQKTL